jgi:hypothetical protein
LGELSLLDLRRYAIRQGIRVEFAAPEAGSCVVNEHGVLKLPDLKGVPPFQFDSTLAGVEQFVLTPVQEPARTRTVSRQDLEALLGN